MLEKLQELPLDPIFKLLAEYQADENPQKVNLGIGLYTDLEGNPFVFEVVKKAWREIDIENFNYQPIGGNREFLKEAAEFVLGDLYKQDEVALQSTCGGTQACSFFSKLMKRAYEDETLDMLMPIPTWGNHFALFEDFYFVEFKHLTEEGELNYAEYLENVKKAKDNSVLILHGGLSHNPSGKNLSLEQLVELVGIMNSKQMTLFVDYAYLGMSEGMQKDLEYLRFLFEKMDKVACGVSFSKNASLYEHRTGFLLVKTGSKAAVESHLQQIARTSVSMAPGTGQELMLNILRNYREEWLEELEKVRLSILDRKNSLIDLLPAKFDYLRDTYGMFALMRLSEEQIASLKADYSIYINKNGRINFAGIAKKQIEYITSSIAEL